MSKVVKLKMKCLVQGCNQIIIGGPFEAFRHCLSHGFLPQSQRETASHFELLSEIYDDGHEKLYEFVEGDHVGM